jgi:hypothetical protein
VIGGIVLPPVSGEHHAPIRSNAGQMSARINVGIWDGRRRLPRVLRLRISGLHRVSVRCSRGHDGKETEDPMRSLALRGWIRGLSHIPK